MVFKIIQNNKIVGFSYYPALEIGFGIFCLIMSFLVPIISFKYNGFKTQQWGEWLFCIGFFLFFFLLGKSLTFQSMRVEVKNNRIYFRQDMRLPAVNLDIELADWEGQTSSVKEESNEKMYFFSIKTKSGLKDFYQTRNESEINQITDNLNKLYQENKGEENGTK
jgi:hypothetical protein